MSEEIFGAVQKLPVNGTKKQVVLQCAPLLTGIKLSNLLNVRADQKEEVFKLFEGSKICCRVLYEFRGRLSILLYRDACSISGPGGCSEADGVLRIWRP